MPRCLCSKFLFSAMFLFTFYTLARVGEVTVPPLSYHTLQLSDITFQSSQNSSSPRLVVTFRSFKHNNDARVASISIVPQPGSMHCPVATLQQYLMVRGNKADCLFLLRNGLPVSCDHFSRALRLCLLTAGLDTTSFTTHSFRIGAATFAALNGLSDPQIRALGRSSSDAFKKYILL
ncbi:uncharacterized protein LOC144861606 [Branchiostoma floridae x Branchiostoma japonicum]